MSYVPCKIRVMAFDLHKFIFMRAKLYDLKDVLQVAICAMLIVVFWVWTPTVTGQESISAAVSAVKTQQNTDDIHRIDTKLDDIMKRLEHEEANMYLVKGFGGILALGLGILNVLGVKFRMSSKDADHAGP